MVVLAQASALPASADQRAGWAAASWCLCELLMSPRFPAATNGRPPLAWGVAVVVPLDSTPQPLSIFVTLSPGTSLLDPSLQFQSPNSTLCSCQSFCLGRLKALKYGTVTYPTFSCAWSWGQCVYSSCILLALSKLVVSAQQPWLERNLSAEIGQMFLTMLSMVFWNTAFLVSQEDKAYFNFKPLV